MEELLNKKKKNPTTNTLHVFLLFLGFGFGIFLVIKNSLNFNVFLTFLDLDVLFVKECPASSV